jgi:hypothetical protein
MSTLAPSKFKDLCRQFQGVSPDGDDYSDFFYQEVVDEILDCGNEGVTYLKSELINQKNHPSRLRAILFGLGQVLPQTSQQRNELNKILLKHLDSPFSLVVTEAIDSLASLRLIQSTERVLSLNQHKSPYVRGSILRFMAKLHPRKAIPLLLESLESADAVVRENAIDELGELEVKEAIPYLSKLLNDLEPNVRQAAETALDNLLNN